MKKVLFTMLALVLAVGLTLPMATPVMADTGASIWTDKPDYCPEETVTIFGSGFNALADITVTVERPDASVDTVGAASDEAGSFTCTYQLDGITGTYTVTATDGTNTAGTTFTDPPPISYHIVRFSGNNQSVELGDILDPFVVYLYMTSGAPPADTPQQNVTVNWAIATKPDNVSGEYLSNASTTTGSDGKTSSTLTIGNRIGDYEVTATASGYGSVAFTVHVTGPSIANVMSSGSTWTGEVDSFSAGDSVYAYIHTTGTGSVTVDIYVVEAGEWGNGDDLTTYVAKASDINLTATESPQYFGPILIWSSATAGDYDIIVDYNQNGTLDGGDDKGDDLSLTIGFTVGNGAEVTVVTVIYDASDDSVIDEYDSVSLATIVYDEATVTGDDPTGDVDFTLYKVVGQFDPESDPPETDDEVIYTDTDVELVDGVATSGDSPALHAGDYYWVASYSGDDYNDPSDSDPEPFTVDKADVTITTTIYTENDDEVTGEYPIASTTIIYDEATVTGIGVAGFEPAGTVDFTYDSTSAGSPTISGDDPATADSDNVGPLAAGDYAFSASYTDSSGDYNDKTSADEPFTVLEVYLGTNGKSMGFWTNKNGQGLLTICDRYFLNKENPFKQYIAYPKAPTGYPPFSTTLNTFKSQVKGFINNANAVDMRYMLAAQLLAVKLDYRHGFLDGDYIWLDNDDGIVQPGEVLSIGDLFTAADNAWLGTSRSAQEYYKDILDGICNNKVWFIVP